MKNNDIVAEDKKVYYTSLDLLQKIFGRRT